MRAQELIAQARARGRAALDEPSGKRLLAAYGVRVPRSRVVQDAREAAAACAELCPPLALKLISPDLLHKSEAGGVRLGLGSAAEVERALRAMMALPAVAGLRIDGFLLEEMAPPGQEMVVGGLRDPGFGPLVMVGLGGIFVEVLDDVAFRICPIERVDAEEMLGELKGAALLEGARGRPRASREAIVDVLLKMGGAGGLLMEHAADIEEADVNPLIVTATEAIAVDARFVLAQR